MMEITTKERLMLKYPCLVLDHDETVVQSEKTIGFPCFCQTLGRIRPGQTITLDEYVRGCHELGFVDMCKQWFDFTEEEMQEEYNDWMEYVKIHIPDPFPGIEKIIHQHKEYGGILCVVSHSSSRNITRDYQTHFGILPDAIYGCEYPKEQQKPSSYPLEDIMKRFGFQPNDLLVVDDMKLACQMAHPVNVPVAFAAWGKTDFPEISKEMRTLCEHTFETVEALYHHLFE
jgi:phosphoglycolate phosphatase/pyrophosphatase PpaX